ncbi:SMI1/KNR4 family protein [Flectobacillus longus]|uniref:SMI1/KNR4 family protein n=1 Tax=Flectobacillus longus TaxID=2984207 RepID=UPI0024B6D93A|nr:SMI1/KNR4 family protein [Flectobacillus longus]MDI9882799.1 SMI1/KNR4 family protein [Flectobacillus longus]
MKKLTLYPRMGDSNVRHIESIINISLSEDFKDFLKANAGLSHYERYFFDKDKTQWEVQKYLSYPELFKIEEELFIDYHRKLVPFAYDPGGWHFCLSFDKDTYGKIIINRWTDHLPEEQFLVIADTFEEFINGLKTEEEAFS